MPQLQRFYASEEEFQRIHGQLKLLQCPYCRQTGMLIKNGITYGYPDKPGIRDEIRGHRIYCSKRGNRTGCGHTVGMFRSEFIRYFSLTALLLWQFWQGCVSGGSKIGAFRALGTSMHESGAYRLYRCLQRNHSRIRTILLRHSSAPSPPRTPDPLRHTLLHLKAVFPEASSPISAFQQTFQISFLS